MSHIKVTRRELYDEVWSRPMIQLAKTYGLSDVGLAKLCKKHDIPRPPRGYWAKKEFGHHPEKTRLPNPSNNGAIVLNDPKDCKVTHLQFDQNVKEAAKGETATEARIEVGDSLRGAHELVSKANQELLGAKKDDDGLLVSPPDATLDVRVSKAELRRALLVMDGLLKALNQRRYATATGPVVTILDQQISFGISEHLDTIRKQPEEHDLDGDYRFGHSRYDTKHVLSGRLVLHIPDAREYWANGCRKSWRDAKKQKVENCLNKFVAGLVEVAARKQEHEIEVKRKRQQEAEAERRRAEEARQRAERRKLQQAEQARLDGLIQQAESWRKSQVLREFIEAVHSAHSGAGPLEAGCETGQWLEWARMQADRLDPLRESPPSILDEEISEERPRYSWER